jgi:hypothetical protein
MLCHWCQTPIGRGAECEAPCGEAVPALSDPKKEVCDKKVCQEMQEKHRKIVDKALFECFQERKHPKP